VINLKLDPPDEALIMKQVMTVGLADISRFLEFFEANRAAGLFVFPFDGPVLGHM
jgi:hypothetical protein